MERLELARTLITRFDRIFVHEKSRNSSVTHRVLDLAHESQVEWVTEKPFTDRSGSLTAEEFNRSKRWLYLEPFRGQFFKRCPGSRPGLVCCNYFVLNLGQQCDMNCSYCYLQSFINFPALTIYTNIEEALSELKALRASVGNQRLRVGTGEAIDSLSLDPLTLYSTELIRFFADYPDWTVEFKTKSDFVDQFLDQPHAGNVIVSWSINPQPIIDREEHGTASLERRLNAAEKCLAKGFQISLHMDPMIWHPEWESNYASLVDEITRRFKPTQIPYMSVGALRFQPEQRHLMRERFGMGSLITQAEVFPSKDGKLRYDRQLRMQMINFVLERFKRHSPDWRIFLCMETPESWSNTDTANPVRSPQLGELFNSKITRAVRSAQEFSR